MPGHHTPLIATIAAGLVLAFALGLVAHRLRVSPLVGYLLAGIVVGPFTPGFIADQAIAAELAELGVILLMFAVGLHFSFRDLMSVRTIAVPGAIAQIGVATLLGAGLGHALGWDLGAGLVFGLALSVASTVVLVRALQERRIVETERGRIAVGWLVVEDLVMVLALVLLPAMAGSSASGSASAWLEGGIALTVALTVAKVGAFLALMLGIGRRALPWVMHRTARTGSRELFRLAVYAAAIGIAYGAAALFGVSFALGAFFAGMVMGESKLSQRATEEALPLRDAFAVLFFVSVGMLFDPRILVQQPFAVLGTVAIILLGKSAAAFAIVRAFRHPPGTALTIAASLAQVGEFSFILAGIGVATGLLPTEGRDLILAGALLSILVNPAVFALAERRRGRPDAPKPGPTTLVDHDVLVGYGRVGAMLGEGLIRAGRPLLVIEDRDDAATAARQDGAAVLMGNAADPKVLALAGLPAAKRLFLTIPEAFEAGQAIEQARAANPGLEILARAHSDAAVAHLAKLGATLTIMGEREIAQRMLDHVAAAPKEDPSP